MSLKINLTQAFSRELSLVVDLHVKSINSPSVEIGRWLIIKLYQSLNKDQNSQIIVAKLRNQVVGFISYTRAHNITTKAIVSNLSIREKFNILRKLILMPLTLFAYVQQIIFHKIFTKHLQNPSIYVLTIAVDPQYRRHQIGAKLMSFCEQDARKHQLSYIILDTLEENERAQAFYEKIGFTASTKAFGNIGLIKKI